MKWKEKCECCNELVWFMDMQLGRPRICNDCAFKLREVDAFPTYILKRVLEERKKVPDGKE